MRRWGYGINSLYKTGSVYLEDIPIWVWVLETFVNWTVCIIPRISFPPIPIRLLMKSSIEWNDGKKWTTLKEWYGSFYGLYWAIIFTPVSEFCWRRTQCDTIEVGYDKLKELFYEENKDFWDEHEELTKEVDC